MSLNKFQVKYNSKNKFFKELNGLKKDDYVKVQNVNEGGEQADTIYVPDFSKYPKWPYENFNDFDETEMPTNQPMQPIQGNRPTPINQPMQGNRPMPINQPMQGNQPMPINQPMQGNRPMQGNQPTQQMPPMGQQPYPVFYRNPYVPVGRERISSGYSRTSHDRDMRLMRGLYGDVNKIIYPIVVQVLNGYEYDGSPIYSEEIDRETMAQLVDRVLTRAGEVSDNVQEAMLEEQYGDTLDYYFDWNKENLLKAAIESILLNEIFQIRRPYYRKVRNRYRYEDGLYRGINYTY